jgi:HlyD family secretion protein
MTKKWGTIALSIALIASIGYGSYSVWHNRQALAQAPGGETTVVERRTLELTANGTGSLIPAAEASLAFTLGGVVEEVLVEEGEIVEAGQSLVRLEPDDFELQVAQAEAALAAAKAQLAQLVAAPRPEQVAVQEANLGVAEAQLSGAAANHDRTVAGADAGQIATAEAQLASATTRRKQAYDFHERTMKCFDIDKTFTLPDGSKNHIDKTICPMLGPTEERARYNWQAAEEALTAAQARLNDLKDGANAADIRATQSNVAAVTAQRDAAQARLDQLLAEPTTEEVEAKQAAVDEARAALDEAQRRLAKATLTAPFSGVVTYLGVDTGELVGANRPILSLSDLSELEVDVNLDESDAARVALGQLARITLDAFSGTELSGEVTYIAPVGETASGVVLYPVTVRLDSTGLPAKAGMTADVEIIVADKKDALVVPLRAVHTEGERAYVERLSGEQVEQADVTLGMMTDTEIEITAGLREGDEVVVVPGPAEDQQRRGPLGLFGGGN